MEEADKIKILFHNLDSAGVNYFRSQTPAMQLERDHSDRFRIEINPELDFNKPETIEYLKSFHIIHYHRQLVSDIPQMLKLANELKSAGVILIMDIDDYWKLDKSHPYYSIAMDKKQHEEIMDNLKIADYITTTTEYFADEIRKVSGKDNVKVFYNSVDPTWMKQFKNNWAPDPDGLVRITYMAGSSHRGDVQQLNGAFNRLNNDLQTKGKFKMILAGWDCEGKTTDVKFNEDFGKILKRLKLWNGEMVKAINRSKGDVDQIPKLPKDVRDKFRNNVFISKERSIDSIESIYLEYEKILTDNYDIIKNDDYKKWLKNYERNKYPNEGTYARRWTQKANVYAEVLNETDIALAPLTDNPFNRAKSNLKQVECWSRKLAVVCTDVVPYNIDGKHMENTVLIPTVNEKGENRNYNHLDKEWYKYLKKLILNENLRKELGENLYNDYKEKFNLKNVTEKRAEFYNEIIVKSLVIS